MRFLGVTVILWKIINGKVYLTVEETARRLNVTQTILEVPNPELTQENDTNVGLDHVEEMQPHQEELSADRHKQIGGNHYAKHTIQPWDIIREYELDFFEGNALKYLLRQKGSRLEDLRKAAHYLEECIKNEQKRIDNV